MSENKGGSAARIEPLQIPELIDLRDPGDERAATSRVPVLPPEGRYQMPWVPLERLRLPERCSACGSGAAYGSMCIDGDDPSGRTKLGLSVPMCLRCEWVLRDCGAAPGKAPASGWLGTVGVPSDLKPAYKQIVGSIRFRVKRTRTGTRVRFMFTNAAMAEAFAELNHCSRRPSRRA
jgi:hypothetical protein